MSEEKGQHCVIVGASHAGTQAALRLRKLRWQGRVTIVGDEPHPPYHRPPLSKDYLKGAKTADDIRLAAEANYEKHGIALRLGERAKQIDRQNRRLLLECGDTLPYTHLVLATGSHPRQLPLPGEDLVGVHYLRNVDDVDRIRASVRTNERAVVIGGGYIGLEVAASLRALDMKVTVLEALPRVLQRVTCETVSSFYTRVHREEGVDLRTNAHVAEIVGDGSVTGVRLAVGDVVDTRLVVVGIGIMPNTSLAEVAGLIVSDGIVVNEFAQTSDPAIYAVGDCTNFFHPRYGRNVRLESVQNANDQAITAAKTMSGQAEGYDSVPWFWSDQYDVKLQIAGLATGADEMVVRANSVAARSMSVLYLKEGKLLAIDAINRPRDFVFGKKLIFEQSALNLTKLGDIDAPLSEAAT